MYSGISEGQLALITNFVNIFVLMPHYVGYLQFTGTRDSFILNNPRVICIIGNTEKSLGLSTLLFHCEATDSNEAVSVHIFVPRIKLYTDTWLNSDKYSATLGVKYCIKDEHGNFCICWAKDERNCQIVYRSVRNEDTEFESSLVLHDGNNNNESLVRTTYLKADLLCNLKQGLMFVSRGCDLDEIYVGKIEADEKTINIRVLFTLHQNSVGIQIEKLIPLAMIENRNNEIVVVCAREGENDKFAMLWPEKTDTDVLEIIEVKYPSVEFADASIVDLEIDPDGNIMYVLENADGKSCCACTRYFMPVKKQ